MNKYTGEVDFKLGDKTYTLVFDWRAIAEYQSRFGKDANIEDFSLEQIAETLLIGLKKHHPDISIDDIMDQSPPLGYVSDCIIEAFVYAHHGVEEGRRIIDEAKNVAEQLQEEVKKKTKSKTASS